MGLFGPTSGAGVANLPAFTALTAVRIETAGEITFSNVPVNRGSHFNTSGGFTAPTNGIYRFSFSAMTQTNSAPSLTTVQFRKNGAILAAPIFITTSQYQVELAPGFPAYMAMNLSANISLAANEYVSVFLDTGAIAANACFTGVFLP